MKIKLGFRSRLRKYGYLKRNSWNVFLLSLYVGGKESQRWCHIFLWMGISHRFTHFRSGYVGIYDKSFCNTVPFLFHLNKCRLTSRRLLSEDRRKADCHNSLRTYCVCRLEKQKFTNFELEIFFILNLIFFLDFFLFIYLFYYELYSSEICRLRMSETRLLCVSFIYNIWVLINFKCC